MAGYQGHKNWAHWNVSLWLYNDEGLYHMVKDAVRSARNLDEAAEWLLEALPRKTPDGAVYSKSNVRAALVGERAGKG